MRLAMGFGETVTRAFQSLRQRRAKQQAVREFRRSLALFVDLEALEASVAARIKELFDPDRLVILLLDPTAGSFRPSFWSGFAPGDPEDVELPLRGRLARWLLVNETCLQPSRDRGVVRYLTAAEQEVLTRLQVRLCAPLLALNQLTGILLLAADDPHWRLSRSDVELLLSLVNQAGLAFQNAALYREQRQRLERLHRAERLAAVGQLAAGVAHEVRNPLTAIRSTMQYLEQSLDPDDPKRELTAELVGEVDRIDGTVSNLLSLARAGELQSVEMEPAALLEQTVQLLEIQARKHQVEIEARYSERPLTVMGDPDRLKQVFLNLILNAIQAMPEGGGITIATALWQPAEESPGDRWAHIRIADTGVGIPPRQLQTVFDPFFTTKREGTGLGLAICHRIIEQHGGEIELQSTEGEGTTVSIRLPLAP